MNARYFSEKLQRSGYRSLQTGVSGICAYRRKLKGVEHIVGIINYAGDCMITGQQLNAITENLAVVYNTQNIMFVVFSSNIYDTRRALEGNTSHWIYDEETQKLIIYDNQPGGFFGVERLFEEKSQNELTQYVFTCNNLIIAVNIIVFTIMEAIGDTGNIVFLYKHGGITPASLFKYHEVYRLFTSMFLHSGIKHLFNNMFVLFFIGRSLENETGKWKYLLIYLGSGILGGIVSQLYYNGMGEQVLCVGASGAVFGVIGAMIVVVAVNKGRVQDFTLPRLIIYVVLSIYLGMTSTGVSVSAHVGGLVAGLLIALLLYRKRGLYT